MRITALDFETANRIAGSICSVGIVTYNNGVEEDSYSSLICPHPAIFDYGWEFEHIHGIRPSDVFQSPELPEILHEITARLTRADIVVCHNAGFDISQLRAALKVYSLTMPDFQYLCTVTAGRKLCPSLPNHKLNTLADHFGIPLRHHDALDDARAAGFLMVKFAKNLALKEFARTYKIKVHRLHQ